METKLIKLTKWQRSIALVGGVIMMADLRASVATLPPFRFLVLLALAVGALVISQCDDGPPTPQ